MSEKIFKPHQAEIDLPDTNESELRPELVDNKRIFRVNWVKNYYVTGHVDVIADSDEQAHNYVADTWLPDHSTLNETIHGDEDWCEVDEELNPEDFHTETLRTMERAADVD